jgi:hypothetical protein
MKFAWVVLALAVTVGCGSNQNNQNTTSPPSPPPAPSFVSGYFTGTVQSTATGLAGVPVSMNFTAGSNGDLTGILQIGGTGGKFCLASGTLTNAAETQTGDISFSTQPDSAGDAVQGSGTYNSTSITLSSLTEAGPACPGAASGPVVLTETNLPTSLNNTVWTGTLANEAQVNVQLSENATFQLTGSAKVTKGNTTCLSGNLATDSIVDSGTIQVVAQDQSGDSFFFWGTMTAPNTITLQFYVLKGGCSYAGDNDGTTLTSQ